ncbi:MAG: hypothetical protein ABL876_19850 [Chitinophagaceae bacterium]
MGNLMNVVRGIACATALLTGMNGIARAGLLEKPKETVIVESDMVRIESGLLGSYAYASYKIQKLIGSVEVVKGDYYCYTNTSSDSAERLSTIHSLAGAAFLIAMKNPDALLAMSEDILRGRCFAPSNRNPMPIQLTGVVFQIVHTTTNRDQWEIAILEGIADIDGKPHLVYVGKTRKLPEMVS